MTILHTTGKLIAHGLLIASLALPSAVFAGEPDKTNGELAPGFNICEKKAADSAKSGAEYKESLLGCLDSAGKYWKNIVREQNQDYMDTYADKSNSEYAQKAVIDFQKAWLQYKEAGSDLVRSDGDPMTTIRARYFEVQETRRQAKVLINASSLEMQETFAPGFDMCVKKAEKSSSTQSEYSAAHSDCLDAAHQYLEAILNKNYEIYEPV